MSRYPEAPMTHDLIALPGVAEASRLPSGGPLVPYLGPQFSPAEVNETDYAAAERVQKLVRAFPVTAIAGIEVEAETEEDLPAALEASLRERMPGIEWVAERKLTGPLRKYGLLHTSLPAPPDEATGQPMALELYGTLVSAGAVFQRGDDWDQYRRTLGHEYTRFPVPSPLVVRLERGVYANVRYTGIGMPFYM